MWAHIESGEKHMRLLVHRAAVAALALFVFASSARAAITYADLYTINTPAGYTEVRPEGSPATAGGKTIGYAYGTATGQQNHAALWNGSSTLIDLHPSGFTYSVASSTDGTQHVGNGYGAATGQVHHAVLWTGNTAASAVDLHPTTGYAQSAALGVGGGFQVGEAVATGANYHAVMWNGTKAVVDLHPAHFTRSAALGVAGGKQVGYANGPTTGGNDHALLWSGSAASVVDLHPASGFSATHAYDVDGGQQVGSGTVGGTFQALLWNGSNAAINLHPDSSFVRSAALSVDDGRQVGYGFRADFMPRALLWDDTAASVVDLQSLLPATFRYLYAYSINDGVVYGVAYDTSNVPHAMTWAIPEPTSLALLACGGGGLLLRRRRA
jgi:hypothetical protein